MYTRAELEAIGWVFTSVDNTGSWTVSVTRTVVTPDVDDDGVDEETIYLYAKTETLEADAEAVVIMYASMIEYSLLVDKWMPQSLAFPESQLYQFIQPATLELLKSMYPDVVITAYNNALAYVQSYVGAMFDVDTMVETGGTTSTALTLRLALCLSTVTFILASSPQYSDVIDMHNRQLHTLLSGLKRGSRNFGKDAVAGDPDVRMTVVSLTKTGNTP